MVTVPCQSRQTEEEEDALRTSKQVAYYSISLSLIERDYHENEVSEAIVSPSRFH